MNARTLPARVALADFSRGCDDVGAELREATAAITVPPRLPNAAAVAALCRTVREGIETLQLRHPEPGTRDDLVLALESLGFELEDHRGYPAISLDLHNPLLEVMNVGKLLGQFEPRRYTAFSQAVRWDEKARVMWFQLEREERSAA